MRSIVKLFAKSPFSAIKAHIVKSKECTDLLKPMFLALQNGRHEEVERLADRISKLEHEADEIKQTIRDHLPKSIFMSVDRSDVLNLIKQQDSIADAAEDLAVILTMRRMELPEQLWPSLFQLIDSCILTFETVYKVLDGFVSAIEITLWGPEMEQVLSLIRDCGTREWEADQAQFSLLKELFSIEHEMNPVTIFMWMKIIKKLGDIADYSQNTADRVRLFVAK